MYMYNCNFEEMIAYSKETQAKTRVRSMMNYPEALTRLH